MKNLQKGSIGYLLLAKFQHIRTEIRGQPWKKPHEAGKKVSAGVQYISRKKQQIVLPMAKMSDTLSTAKYLQN